jgi:uncharacterized membrane protein
MGYVPGNIRLMILLLHHYALILTFVLLYFIGVFATNVFLIYLPESDIVETNMTIEEGITPIIFGSILVPEKIEFSSRGRQGS